MIMIVTMLIDDLYPDDHDEVIRKGANVIQLMRQISFNTHFVDGASSDIHHFDGYFLSSR